MHQTKERYDKQAELDVQFPEGDKFLGFENVSASEPWRQHGQSSGRRPPITPVLV